jgi:LmbE family N-acetylglucosaminyl deacetylase
MKPLALVPNGAPLKILCIGAHCDDIEIGLGGAILSLIESNPGLLVRWCVCSAKGVRADEAEASAADFLKGAFDFRVHFGKFDDSYFPAQARQIKEWLAGIRANVQPDVVFTHAHDDAHQDHRQINEITWNLFRDHLILEYEIPKWDGETSRPNVYVPLTREIMDRKAALLMAHFGSQSSKDWFDVETFKGLARLRGMECRAPERYAEAFTLRKAKIVI